MRGLGVTNSRSTEIFGHIVHEGIHGKVLKITMDGFCGSLRRDSQGRSLKARFSALDVCFMLDGPIERLVHGEKILTEMT